MHRIVNRAAESSSLTYAGCFRTVRACGWAEINDSDSFIDSLLRAELLALPYRGCKQLAIVLADSVRCPEQADVVLNVGERFQCECKLLGTTCADAAIRLSPQRRHLQHDFANVSHSFRPTLMLQLLIQLVLLLQSALRSPGSSLSRPAHLRHRFGPAPMQPPPLLDGILNLSLSSLSPHTRNGPVPSPARLHRMPQRLRRRGCLAGRTLACLAAPTGPWLRPPLRCLPRPPHGALPPLPAPRAPARRPRLRRGRRPGVPGPASSCVGGGRTALHATGARARQPRVAPGARGRRPCRPVARGESPPPAFRNLTRIRHGARRLPLRWIGAGAAAVVCGLGRSRRTHTRVPRASRAGAEGRDVSS